MNTRKNLSTISYNSVPYLQKVLKNLIDEEIIISYMYILHKKEEDELKDHIHLYIVPNKQVNTLSLKKRFFELDEKNITHPLGTLEFKPSNSDDWILYCSHYAPYLVSKGESRVFEYSKDDFVYSDYYIFEDDWLHAFKASEWAKSYNVLKNLDNGMDPYELVRKGIVPFSLSNQLIAYEKLKVKHTFRNGRNNHECQV